METRESASFSCPDGRLSSEAATATTFIKAGARDMKPVESEKHLGACGSDFSRDTKAGGPAPLDRAG